MKKKSIKKYVGKVFILKQETFFVNPKLDDYEDLPLGTCLMLVDVIPATTLLPQLAIDGLIDYDLKFKLQKPKRLKHLLSFLCGQKILYWELSYKQNIKEFYTYFGLPNNKNSNAASNNKVSLNKKSYKTINLGKLLKYNPTKRNKLKKKK